MFKTEKLTNKLSQQDYEILDLELKVILEDYFKFLTSKVDKKTGEGLKQKYNDTICYIADRSTPLPRTLNGENKSFILPARAVSFVRDSYADNSDPKLTHLKGGIALFYKEYMMGTLCHEMNHTFARASQFSDVEGGEIKEGLNLSVIKNDKFVYLTGNLMDEGITDAIAAYYYNSHADFIKEIFGSCPVYNCAYNSIRQACEILLGKDLSNKTLLNAYFGDKEAMQAFEKEFDEVMKDEGIHFADILKTSFEYKDCIDGVNYTDRQLTYYFSKYQLKTCSNEKELHEKMQWLNEKGVTEEFLKTFNDEEENIKE